MNSLQALVTKAEEQHPQGCALLDDTPERGAVEARLAPAMVAALQGVRLIAALQVAKPDPQQP